MIQDIAPHRMKIEYGSKRSPQKGDYVVYYREGSVMAESDPKSQSFRLPHWKGEENLQYLFSIDEDAFFLADALPEEASLVSLKELRAAAYEPKEQVFAAFTAMHLAEWYRKNRFCGRCGGKMLPDQRERALRCPDCGNIVYPRINPAVIVGVINGDRLLLTRYARGFAHNALVAGFVEIGETLEDAVRREVKEETGLSVKNIRYYGSQPWGVAGDLLAGFFCEVDGEETIVLEEEELSSARFVPREEIELQPAAYSLTNEMMETFKEGRIKVFV